MSDSSGLSANQISRRVFIASASAAVCGSALAGCGLSAKQSSKQNQLNIYSWADYIHPDTIPEFEKRYNLRVVYDTFSSNESLLAKMQAGATEYDIVVPTSYMVTQLTKLGLLGEIDHSRVAMLKNIMPRFLDPVFDRHLKHSVPYTWGTTGIGYVTDAFASPRDYPHDWDSFWNEKLRGRMTLLDDARESIGMAMKRHGFSYNSQNQQEIELGANDLKKQKPLVMCYTSDQVIVQLAAGDSWLALGYSGDVYQATKDNKSVRYVIPQSGSSLWLDSFCIPATAPHSDNAYKWLNFMLEPKIAAANAMHTRYATPNQLAFKLIDPALRADPNLYPSEQLLDKCNELGDIGRSIFTYDRLWTELKCT